MIKPLLFVIPVIIFLSGCTIQQGAMLDTVEGKLIDFNGRVAKKAIKAPCLMTVGAFLNGIDEAKQYAVYILCKKDKDG